MIHYEFSNRTMFAIVMQNESLCKQFIERVFPGKKVRKINMLTTEKTITVGIETKSVRLDAMFEGDNKIYDIEMQIATEDALPQRIRYYHSAIDRQILNSGDNYEDLRDSYVIFVCRYDPFKLGKAVYKFKTIEENLNLKLNDGCNTIVLNTKSPIAEIPEELKPLFEYIESGKVAQDAFVHEIDEKVEKANLDEEVHGIMTLEEDMRMRERRNMKKLKKEIAKNFKQAGVPIEVIAENTGLTIEEVEEL